MRWLGAVVLLCTSLAAGAAPPPARDAASVLELAGCPGQAGEYRAVLDDQLLLDRLFLDPASDEDEQIREAVLQQRKYLWGYYRTQPGLHHRDQLVLSAEAPTIEIRAKRAVPYGRDLALPWRESGPHLRIDQPYQQRAIRRGFTRKGDPAVRVEYRVTFKVAICGAPRAATSTLPTLLPEDPWLMHWTVPEAAHGRLCYFGECARTNPCNDDDYGELPHPFYHWYDWHPVRRGLDADGRSFDCRALLKPGVDYFARTVRLTRLPAPSGDFTRLRAAFARPGPLRVTVVIGVLDHLWKDLAFDALAAALSSGRPLVQRAAELVVAPEPRERGTAKFLALLADLPEVMGVEAGRVVVEGAYLRADLDGRLARSRRPVHVSAFVGLTDIFGPTPPQHFALLRRALETDDVIVYAGHSGIGENFRLARIEEELREPPESVAAAFERAPRQLIAFLSCYSYMYFGQDLVAAAGHTAAGREFVYTGTDFTRGDRGSLAILDFVDQVLAGAARLSLRYVEPAEFLMIKRVDGAGNR